MRHLSASAAPVPPPRGRKWGRRTASGRATALSSLGAIKCATLLPDFLQYLWFARCAAPAASRVCEANFHGTCRQRPELLTSTLEHLETFWIDTRCDLDEEAGDVRAARKKKRPPRAHATNSIVLQERERLTNNEGFALELWRYCGNSHLHAVSLEVYEEEPHEDPPFGGGGGAEEGESEPKDDANTSRRRNKKLVSRATWPRESDWSPLQDPYNKWFQFGKTAYEINAGAALDHRMTFHWGQYELSQFSDYELGAEHNGCSFTNRIDWRIMKRFLRVPDREWQCAKLVREGNKWNLITILEQTLEHPGANFPYSGIRDDCFLGTVSFFLLDTLCAETPDDFFNKLKNVLLYLEGLIFYGDADSEVRQQFGAATLEMGKAIHDYSAEAENSKASESERDYLRSIYAGDFSPGGAAQGNGDDTNTTHDRGAGAISASKSAAGAGKEFSTKESAAFEWKSQSGSAYARLQSSPSEAEAVDPSFSSSSSAPSPTSSLPIDAAKPDTEKAGSNLHAYSKLVMETEWPIFVLLNDISEVISANMHPHLPNQCDLLDHDRDADRGGSLLAFFTHHTRGVYVGNSKHRRYAFDMVNDNQIQDSVEIGQKASEMFHEDWHWAYATDHPAGGGGDAGGSHPGSLRTGAAGGGAVAEKEEKLLQGGGETPGAETTGTPITASGQQQPPSPGLAESIAQTAAEELQSLQQLELEQVETLDYGFRARVSVEAEALLNDPRNCPFAQAAAALVGAYKEHSFADRQAWVFLAFDLLKSWDAFATDRSGYDRRFFYDLFTTRWPVLRFLALWYEERAVLRFGRGSKTRLLHMLENDKRALNAVSLYGGPEAYAAYHDHGPEQVETAEEAVKDMCMREPHSRDEGDGESPWLSSQMLEWQMYESPWRREGTDPFWRLPASAGPAGAEDADAAAAAFVARVLRREGGGVGTISEADAVLRNALRGNSLAPRMAESAPRDQASGTVDTSTSRRVAAALAAVQHSRRRRRLTNAVKQLALRGREMEQNKDAVCGLLPKLDIVFVAGSKAGSGYGSFTVRGRQMARGLRVFGRVKARAWNFECTQYCDHLRDWHALNERAIAEYKEQVLRVNWHLSLSEEEKRNSAPPPFPETPHLFQDPNVVVHVKMPCKCLFSLLDSRETIHILDPIDILLQDWAELREQFGFDAVLMQTSLAARDMEAHARLGGRLRQRGGGARGSGVEPDGKTKGQSAALLNSRADVDLAVDALVAREDEAEEAESDGTESALWSRLRTLAADTEPVRQYLDSRLRDVVADFEVGSEGAEQIEQKKAASSWPMSTAKLLAEISSGKETSAAPGEVSSPSTAGGTVAGATVDEPGGNNSKTGYSGFYWLPLHHSNFHGLRNREPQPEANFQQTFGVHSTHYDKGLFDAIRDFLAAEHPNATFQHIDPNGQFVFTGGHILSPQQTTIVYKTFQSFDLTAMRTNQNCDAGENKEAYNNTRLSKKFFCDRYKTGQRLLNHFAAGIPAVVFREAGPMDVCGEDYPLLVDSVAEATEKIDWLLRADVETRRKLREHVISLSKDYTLENLAWRFLFVLADVVAKTGKI